MKKYLLLFAFSALIFNSCKDEDVLAYEIDMLKGDWKTAKTEIVSGADDKTVLSSDTPSGCSAQNITTFHTDFTALYTAYTLGKNGKCVAGSPTNGKYTYNEKTKEMTINLGNSGDYPYEVLILSSTELKLKQKFNNIDVNGDTKIDVSYITYKR